MENRTCKVCGETKVETEFHQVKGKNSALTDGTNAKHALTDAKRDGGQITKIM
jgi:hypothetical protein